MKKVPVFWAAKNMDWQQVVLNGGPPCFHLGEDGFFCGRAERWEGHKRTGKHAALHKFISLAELLQSVSRARITTLRIDPIQKSLGGKGWNALSFAGGHCSGNAWRGVELIKAERLRQISQEGWSLEHDATHKKHELALAASSYLNAVASPDEEGDENGKVRPCWDWPWAKKWWKPSDDPVRNLVKAGALIAAEIDRLESLKAKPANGELSSEAKATHE